MTAVFDSSTGSDKLRPCPLCGSAASFIKNDFPPIGFRYGVECRECDCRCDYRKVTEAEAATQWNFRSGDAAQAAPDLETTVNEIAARSPGVPKATIRQLLAASVAPEPLPAGDKGEAVGCGDPFCKDPHCTYGNDDVVAWRWRSIFNEDSWCVSTEEPVITNDQYIVEPLYAAPQPASNAGGEKAIALLRWGTWYMTPAARLDWVKRAEAFLADQSVDVAYEWQDISTAPKDRVITARNANGDRFHVWWQDAAFKGFPIPGGIFCVPFLTEWISPVSSTHQNTPEGKS